MKNRLGRVLSSSYCQEVITSSVGPGPMRGLVKGLEDLKKGETRQIALPASEAYGFYDPELVLQFAPEDLPSRKAPRIGESLSIRDDQGQTRLYRVSEIEPGQITLDANHPLAGQDLIFEVEALAARDATPEEISGADEESSGTLMANAKRAYAN